MPVTRPPRLPASRVGVRERVQRVVVRRIAEASGEASEAEREAGRPHGGSDAPAPAATPHGACRGPGIGEQSGRQRHGKAVRGRRGYGGSRPGGLNGAAAGLRVEPRRRRRTGPGRGPVVASSGLADDRQRARARGLPVDREADDVEAGREGCRVEVRLVRCPRPARRRRPSGPCARGRRRPSAGPWRPRPPCSGPSPSPSSGSGRGARWRARPRSASPAVERPASSTTTLRGVERARGRGRAEDEQVRAGTDGGGRRRRAVLVDVVASRPSSSPTGRRGRSGPRPSRGHAAHAPARRGGSRCASAVKPVAVAAARQADRLADGDVGERGRRAVAVDDRAPWPRRIAMPMTLSESDEAAVTRARERDRGRVAGLRLDGEARRACRRPRGGRGSRRDRRAGRAASVVGVSVPADDVREGGARRRAGRARTRGCRRRRRAQRGPRTSCSDAPGGPRP